MPSLKELRGLMASDRTKEEQQAIEDVMGYKKEPEQPVEVKPKKTERPTHIDMPAVQTTPVDERAEKLAKTLKQYKQDLGTFKKELEERKKQYGVGVSNLVNSDANSRLNTIADEVSSYYKKYKGTDYLPLGNEEKKKVMSEYDARRNSFGEDHANRWLDKYMKNKVGENQSWWEQALHSVSHLMPAIEGGLIQTYGMLHGAIAHAIGADGYDKNPDLNWWDSFWNDVIDNPITRYGRDMEHSGASHVSDVLNVIGLTDNTAAKTMAATKATATKYNPEGLGADEIVPTAEQEESYLSSVTPWQGLQAGGFTALSMMTGAAEAKGAQMLFGQLAKGANWLNKTGRIIKTAEGLEKTLEGLKKAQNFTNITVIPGAVGSVEGAMEGLNTKIQVERESVENLNNYYNELIAKEAEALYNQRLKEYDPNVMIEVDTDNGKTLIRQPKPDLAEVFNEVWDKYEEQYTEARRQIDWASTKAGVHNFFANSLINGMMMSTLKAGLTAPSTQEAIRNSKMFGWAYKNPKFKISPEGVVNPKMTKAGTIKQILKEPFGEATEEYLQSLSDDTFSAAAENNIDEFVKAKFSPEGNVKVGETFASDYAAALSALKESLTNKESIESAILGAVSSTLGTVGGTGRGYHRDAKGNVVQNSLFDPRNYKRGLKSDGTQESWMDYARRATPWRSGLVNAYFDRKKEWNEAKESAANMTEWLKDPRNRAKWDGGVGTAEFISKMQNAAESNDQFSYRKSATGEAINEVFMLQDLKGTDLYETTMADLQRASAGDVSAETIQSLREKGGEEYAQKSDQEIVEKIQSNANKMLGLMTQVEEEGKRIDRLVGRIDKDTKQSLIYGRLMEQDFKERRDQLKEEIDLINRDIQSSTGRSGTDLTEEQKKLILKYGSLNQAIKVYDDLVKEESKINKHIEELEAIGSKKLSDAQKKDLAKSKKKATQLEKEIDQFDAIKDEEGKIDASLPTMVMNEEEIMELDPVTRAMVLAQGASKFYNATHQNREKVDQLNLEIDELNNQIEALEQQKKGWITSEGKVKKGHNKQYQRNTNQIAELQKQKDAKMRQLDAEQGKQDSKPVYSSAQQEVIDNLIQQGMAQDPDFLDKVVDMGRLEKGIKDYHTQYQAVLSDPKVFQNYVNRAKYNAQRDLTRRRAKRIAGIQDYQEYAQELDKLTANASHQEATDIMNTLREEDNKQKKQYQEDNMVVDPNTGDLVAPTETPKTNLDKYLDNVHQQADLIRQFAKNPNLTDNDQSLLMDAMQYLSSKGIDVTDREAAVEALIEKDEEGNTGGKFRQFVEEKNAMMPEQQRAFMPVYTSIGQVVSQYVDLLNGQQEDAINRGNITLTVAPVVTTTSEGATIIAGSSSEGSPAIQPEPEHTPPPALTPAPGIFAQAYSSPEGGQLTDDNGTVATDSQTKIVQQKAEEEQIPEEKKEGKSALTQAFEQVTTPEIAAMVDDSSNLITNSNETEEVKNIAMQYLTDVAVNSDDKLSTMDDVLDEIQSQITRLKEVANTQEEENNPYDKAAGLLQKVYGSLVAKKARGRKRTLRPTESSRPENPRASWIHTANIAYMEKVNPEAWAVKFYNDHAVDEWNRDNTIDLNTPVYFITDSEWSDEVSKQMTPSADILSINPNHRQYDVLTDMPIVAAVRVDAPQNPASTTAIEVGGLWYQPIGVMPSSKAKSSGAELTANMRKLANKEEGRHLITQDGMPNGRPLITKVYGANYLTAHHPDTSTQQQRENSEANNTDIVEDILNTLPRETTDRLKALPRNEMLNDPDYREARNKFLNGLVWQDESADSSLADKLTYVPNNRRQGEKGQPIIIFTKPMSETTGRTDSRTLSEVLKEGTGEEVRTFNSRTQRLYDEIIRPLFQFIQYNPVSNTGDRTDRSAGIITQEDLVANPNAFEEEAQRIEKMLTGFNGTDETKGLKGISNFIYIKPNSGWSIKVTAPEALQVVGDSPETSQTTYKVFFINNDPSIQPVELGTIKAGQRDTDVAMEMLRNIMWDAEAGQVRDFLNWQIPKADIQNIKETNARRNIAAIVDDGILSLAASSLVYDIDGVKLKAPISSDGRIIYPTETVVNKDNATPAAPINSTPMGDGAIVTGNGASIEPDSGADLGNNNPPAQPRESEKLRKAKALVEKITADSKEFILSEDETYYYITNKQTGEKEKYLRVTTVIGADNSVPQWTPSVSEIIDKLRERHTIPELTRQQMNVFTDINKMSAELDIPVSEIRRAVAELRTEHKHTKYGVWGVPSTAIGNTVDRIVRDFFHNRFYMIGAEQRGDGSIHYVANTSLSRSEATENELEKVYPNMTREAIAKLVYQLALFKNDLDSRGIHIFTGNHYAPEVVVAHGIITMVDADGTVHDTKVAGTLDLFGYDDEGNFYIFDMKTTRDHSAGKLIKEKDKWSRQISMYADLLKQSYPGFEIDDRNLRIIPINVDYPTPMGSRSDRLDPNGPQYHEGERRGQLYMDFRGGTAVNQPFTGANPEMRATELDGQFQPGYTPFNINWDNLSSEDQDIADALTTRTGDETHSTEQAPESAYIETQKKDRPSFLSPTIFLEEEPGATAPVSPKAPPIVLNGETPILPSWRNLSAGAKLYLAENGWIEENTMAAYNELLNNPADAEAAQHELKCHGLM